MFAILALAAAVTTAQPVTVIADMSDISGCGRIAENQRRLTVNTAKREARRLTAAGHTVNFRVVQSDGVVSFVRLNNFNDNTAPLYQCR